jgi:small-conductance mechanosensitive channel
MVTIDNRYGAVDQLRARYMVVRSLDGTEAIIPNETLITSTVINHTHSSTRVLVKMPVQISYRSSPELAMRIMADAAKAETRVLTEPEPVAVVRGLGDNGIDLELFFWVADPENGFAMSKSSIYLAILKSFHDQGIEIPYPQREVRLISTANAPLSNTVQ